MMRPQSTSASASMPSSNFLSDDGRRGESARKANGSMRSTQPAPRENDSNSSSKIRIVPSRTIGGPLVLYEGHGVDRGRDRVQSRIQVWEVNPVSSASHAASLIEGANWRQLEGSTKVQAEDGKQDRHSTNTLHTVLVLNAIAVAAFLVLLFVVSSDGGGFFITLAAALPAPQPSPEGGMSFSFLVSPSPSGVDLGSSGLLNVSILVPDLGLDFSATMLQPLPNQPQLIVLDQLGRPWGLRRAVPFNITLHKTNTAVVVDMLQERVGIFRSVSESITYKAGSLGSDTRCTLPSSVTGFKCCQMNSTTYSMYTLVPSPIPPFACTQPGPDIPGGMGPSVLSYAAHVYALVGPGVFEAESGVGTLYSASLPKFNSGTEESICCAGTSLQSCLGAPFFVPTYMFGSSSRLVGYSIANYAEDRANCRTSPLGFYSSINLNNTDQLSAFASTTFSVQSGCSDLPLFVRMTNVTNIASIGLACSQLGPGLTNLSMNVQHLLTVFQPQFLLLTCLQCQLLDAGGPLVTLVADVVTAASSTQTWISSDWTIAVGITGIPAPSFTAKISSIIVLSIQPTRLTVALSSADVLLCVPSCPMMVQVTLNASATNNGSVSASFSCVAARTVVDQVSENESLPLRNDLLLNHEQSYFPMMFPDSSWRTACLGDYVLDTVLPRCVLVSSDQCSERYATRRRIVDPTSGGGCVPLTSTTTDAKRSLVPINVALLRITATFNSSFLFALPQGPSMMPSPTPSSPSGGGSLNISALTAPPWMVALSPSQLLKGGGSIAGPPDGDIGSTGFQVTPLVVYSIAASCVAALLVTFLAIKYGRSACACLTSRWAQWRRRSSYRPHGDVGRLAAPQHDRQQMIAVRHRNSDDLVTTPPNRRLGTPRPSSASPPPPALLLHRHHQTGGRRYNYG